MFHITPWKRNATPAVERCAPPASSFQRDFDHLFGRFFDDAWTLGAGADPLRLDVRETADALIVRAEVPGIEPQDIAIEIHGDLLTISGEKRAAQDGQEGKLTYSERSFGTFRRALRLATPVEPDKVRAEHKHGVVTITLNKAESQRPRRIEVRPS